MPTTVTFWNQMGAFNEATLPIQIIMSVLAVILTYFVFAKAGARVNTLMKLFLSFAFAWNGIVFFLIFARSMVSVFFSALFIIVAILFAIDIFKKKTNGILDSPSVLVPGDRYGSWSLLPKNLYAYGPLPANRIRHRISCSRYSAC